MTHHDLHHESRPLIRRLGDGIAALWKRPAGKIAAGIAVVGLGWVLFAGGNGAPVSAIEVTRGEVAQEVSVTGKTKPVADVALAFERSGTVLRVPADVGAKVKAGDTLAELNRSELAAQLAEAEANVAAQRAKLQETLRGTRPEEIQVKRTELEKARQDLTNNYASVHDVVNDAYAKTDDAVRKQIDDFFTNDETIDIQLSFSISESSMKGKIEAQRITMANILNRWRSENETLAGTSAEPSLDTALMNAQGYLAQARVLFDLLNQGLQKAVALSDAAVTAHRTSVNTARTNVNAALTSVNAQTQTIAAQKITVRRIENELSLALAGSTPEGIATARAQVAQVEAQRDLIQSQIAKTYLRSPIDGVVTKQDAKQGEIAPAGTPVAWVISEQDLEIESNIPEVDIGKIATGNPVRIVFDAFPGSAFTGTVFAIDPAETIVDGVVNYRTRIRFDPREATADGRVLEVKSGLTANLDIRTLVKPDALLLPQYAIRETDAGAFVDLVEGETIRQTPVTVGIRGENGMVEVLSGVRMGDKVLNVGAKTSK